MKNIQLKVLDDGVGIASMDMPGRPFNVFSEDMMDDLSELIDYARSHLKGLVLTSSKSAFVAGADLGMIKDFANMRFYSSPVDMKQRFSTLGQIFRRLELLPIPVVAAINGLALGGGLEVAMACHGRVCVDTPAPLLGLPEIQLGLLPGAGGTQRLPRYIGLEDAVEMLLVGNPITPAQALEKGLVDSICPAEELIDKALKMVRRIDAGALWDKSGWQSASADVEKIRSGDWPAMALTISGWAQRRHELYPAVDAIIRCLGRGLPLSIDAGCQFEWDIFVELMSDPVVANMVVTCFLNKTAAPKRALQQLPEGVKAGSYHWASSLPEPKRLSRQCAVADADQADVVLSDAVTAEAAENEILLLPRGRTEEPLNARGPLIGFAADLSAVEAVEIFGADTESSARAVSIATALAKIPVLVKRPEGVIQPVLNRLAQSLDAAEDRNSLLAAVVSVELDDTLKLFDETLVLPPASQLTADDHALGLNLLAELSLEAYGCLLNGTIDDPEMLDVLMVYGLGFPKWSGGAVSFLAMLQRREIDPELLSVSVSQALTDIVLPLKDKAAYKPVARLSSR